MHLSGIATQWRSVACSFGRFASGATASGSGSPSMLLPASDSDMLTIMPRRLDDLLRKSSLTRESG